MPHEHGKSKESVQWYEQFPKRLAEEEKLVRESYPDFEVQKKKGENIAWIGNAKFARTDGSVLFELSVKIECPINYPTVFPVVHDLSKKLEERGCPHIYSDTKNICYGNRLDPQLDFTNHARIRDLIDYISAFLGKQWYFEKFGDWPSGHAHGSHAFLEYEIENERIDPGGLCPCGNNTKTYSECDMIKVRDILNNQNQQLSAALRDAIPVPGRNDLCPCNSKVKFKKCCFNEINYPTSRPFLMRKYPKWVRARFAAR